MGRTKGSKNGVSTTPGYVAIGQRAQNDWQQQAARARGMTQQVNPYAIANSQLSANQQIQQTATDAKDRQREAAQAYAKLILQRIQDQKAAKEAAKRAKKDKHKASQAGGTNDWQRTANATAAGVSVEREPYTAKVKTHEEYAKARIKARKKALRARKARKKK